MKCSACGFENTEQTERCSQCGAEIKRSVYVASVSTGLKRLEKEKLSFLGEDSIPLVSKYSDEDVARFAMLTPMDEKDIDRLAECDETKELKEIASSPERFETVVLDPLGTDILSESGSLRPVNKALLTRAIPDSRVYKIEEADSGVEPLHLDADAVEDIQDVDANEEIEDISDADIQEIDAASCSDGDVAEEKAVSSQVPLDKDNASDKINEKLQISLSYTQKTMFDQVQDLDLDAVEEGDTASEESSGTREDGSAEIEDADALDGETLYDEIQSVDAIMLDIPESEVVDADVADAVDGEHVQDVGAIAVQAGEKSTKPEEVVEFRTIYEEIQQVDAVDVVELDDKADVSDADAENDVLKKLRDLEKAQAPEPENELPKNSVYGALPVENVGVSSAADIVEVKGIDQIPRAEVDTVIPKNARILRHDFRMVSRAKANPDASAMDKLKADGVFDMSKSHAEVDRNIDNLILDEILPRAEFSTWHGDVSIDELFKKDNEEKAGSSSNNTKIKSDVSPLAMLKMETSEQKEPTVVADVKAVEDEKKLADIKAASVKNGTHGDPTKRYSISDIDQVEACAMVDVPEEEEEKNEGLNLLSPIDLTEEPVVGAVSEAAPDNETLASIADKIVPKSSGVANAAVTKLSKEIPCPYDDADEKAHDEKMLSLLEEEQELEGEETEDEKTELVSRTDIEKASSLDQLSIDIEEMKKKNPRRSLVKAAAISKDKKQEDEDNDDAGKASVSSDKKEYEVENAPAKKPLAEKISLDAVSQSDVKLAEPKHEAAAKDKSSGVSAFLWCSVFLVFIVGCLYLLYIMGFFAGIDPRLDPHRDHQGPVLVSAPAYETSKTAIRRAITEAQDRVGQAFDFEAYAAQNIETDLIRAEEKTPEEIEHNLTLYQWGLFIYPEKLEYIQGIAQSLLEAKRYADVHRFISTLLDADAQNPDIFEIERRAYLEDAHFLSPVETIVASDFDNLSPLGGGSTLTFKLIREGVPVAAVKPLQTRLQSNYRAEIASWRLCEFLKCDFKVPYNKEIRFEQATFNLMYSRSKSNKAEAYKKEFIDLRWKKDETDGKSYLYATYKEWIPDYTRFPIELKNLWKPWLTASTPMTEYPELKDALKPIYYYAPTNKLYDDVLRRSAEMTTEQLASQISQVLTFDFLIGNFDRFSGVPQWYGVNCQFKNGRIVSIDNGAGFQWGGNTQVTERFMLVERFSRHFIQELRRLDKETTCELLFPNRDSKDQAGCDQFWKRRSDVLERVQALIEQYGEAAVLAFP